MDFKDIVKISTVYACARTFLDTQQEEITRSGLLTQGNHTSYAYTNTGDAPRVNAQAITARQDVLERCVSGCASMFEIVSLLGKCEALLPKMYGVYILHTIKMYMDAVSRTAADKIQFMNILISKCKIESEFTASRFVTGGEKLDVLVHSICNADDSETNMFWKSIILSSYALEEQAYVTKMIGFYEYFCLNLRLLASDYFMCAFDNDFTTDYMEQTINGIKKYIAAITASKAEQEKVANSTKTVVLKTEEIQPDKSDAHITEVVAPTVPPKPKAKKPSPPKAVVVKNEEMKSDKNDARITKAAAPTVPPKPKVKKSSPPPKTLAPTKDLSSQYEYDYSKGSYNLQQAIYDYFPALKRKYRKDDLSADEIVFAELISHANKGAVLWKWMLAHFKTVLTKSKDAAQLGESIFSCADSEQYGIILNLLKNGDALTQQLFEQAAYARRGYVGILGAAFEQGESALLDKMLCYYSQNKNQKSGYSYYKMLVELLTIVYDGWSAENLAVIESAIERVYNPQQKRTLTRTLYQKRDKLLRKGSLETRRKMLTNAPPKANGNPFSLPEDVDLSDWYYDGEDGDYLIKLALCDYFPDIRESYYGNDDSYTNDILNEIFEIDFDYAMKIWRWLLCHFKAIIPTQRGGEITESVLNQFQYSEMEPIVHELEKDDCFTEILFLQNLRFGEGSMQVFNTCIAMNKIDLFEKIFEMYLRNPAKPSNMRYDVDAVLESILGNIDTNMTKELYQYLFSQVESIPKALRKKLLRQRLAQKKPTDA